MSEVELLPISADAAAAILGGDSPPGQEVPDDYPSEFSAGVAGSAGRDGIVGPYFIRRLPDQMVVGEIGGAFTDDGTVEIGYAVVPSLWGQGYATAAVREMVRALRAVDDAERIVAHTPLDRPASGRVLEKGGFTDQGETEDEHEGETLVVREWELRLQHSTAPVATPESRPTD